MRDRGRGLILNVASLAGLVAGPGLGPYAATKHAVVGLTLGLHSRIARAGEVADFTGISSPYEPPTDADATIDTAATTARIAVQSALPL